ncbi:flagellar export chaperone FliS [Nocardioides campestrisoli]|uniref:flagellar export chaperone FliS n=1 Tax=Nocardioides campestrisoli TaxID=2736757 RepID=UPI0015E71B88|nr:flagellar export chaperone FliS [Nocardioides campestrisoli]
MILMVPSNARAAYLGASVNTASPERLLVMLCERLVLDVRRAKDAQDAGTHAEAHTLLLHAQDIVVELRSTLRTDAWDGATQLAALYDWMFGQLVLANTRRDSGATQHVLGLAEQLADTWREAALQQAAAS